MEMNFTADFKILSYLEVHKKELPECVFPFLENLLLGKVRFLFFSFLIKAKLKIR